MGEAMSYQEKVPGSKASMKTESAGREKAYLRISVKVGMTRTWP